MHGQSDQQRLLRTDRQRRVDRMWQELQKTLAYTAAYRRHQEVSAELTELVTRPERPGSRLAAVGIEEIAAASPSWEEAELLAEETRLHADALRMAG